MLDIEYPMQFKRDVKLAEKRGKNLDKLKRKNANLSFDSAL